MQVYRQKSPVRRITGLIIGASFAAGLIGLGVILASGFVNTPAYWNSLWNFAGLLVVGIVGARIHGMVWKK